MLHEVQELLRAFEESYWSGGGVENSSIEEEPTRVLNRKLCRLNKKVSNKISSYYNLLKLSFLGVKHGSHCCIHGKFGATIYPKAKLYIGNDFYMSNGKHMNALCGNSQGHFHVEDNATLTIGNHVAISSTRFWCAKSITIGNHVLMGGNVTIIDTDAHSINYIKRREETYYNNSKNDASILIEDDVFIGMNTIILKGVTIGARSVIGAGSVVVKDIAAGNPCVIIKKII